MKRIKFLLIMMELHVTNLFKLFSGTDTSASSNLDFALVLVELAHVLVDTLTQLVAIIFLASNSLFRVVFLFFVTVKLFPQFFCFFAKSVNSKMVNVEGLLVFSDPFLLDFTISLSLVWLVLFSSSQVSTVVKRHVCDCGLLPCLFLLPLLSSSSSFFLRSSLSSAMRCFSFSWRILACSIRAALRASILSRSFCSSSSSFFLSSKCFAMRDCNSMRSFSRLLRVMSSKSTSSPSGSFGAEIFGIERRG